MTMEVTATICGDSALFPDAREAGGGDFVAKEADP